MPERRSDSLPQSLRIDVERVLSGTLPESLVIQGAGWVAMNNGETWHRTGTPEDQPVRVGDRGVIPLFLSPGTPTGPPTYAVSCTGAFVIEDGRVRPRDQGAGPAQDSVNSMTEDALVTAIEKLAG